MAPVVVSTVAVKVFPATDVPSTPVAVMDASVSQLYVHVLVSAGQVRSAVLSSNVAA